MEQSLKGSVTSKSEPPGPWPASVSSQMVRTGLKGKNMRFTKIALATSVAALSLGLAACDSKKENAAEDQADAVRASAEATADAMEATADKKDPVSDGKDSAAENAQEDKAAAVRASGEAKADAMEDKADKAH